MNGLRRPTGPGEASVALRTCVFAATVIAVLSVLGSDTGGPLHWFGAFVVLPMGTVVSYRLRDTRPAWLPFLVGTLLIGGLVTFMLQVAGNAATTSTQLQSPLVELLVWVAVVRSFDLRHRRDLLFALGGSGALIAVAASLSTSAGFAVSLVPWSVLSIMSLTIAHRRDLAGDVAPGSETADVAGALRTSVGLLGLTTVLGTLVFLLVPAPRLSTAFLSSALPRALGVGAPGELSNASTGNGQFDYIGFSSTLDTGLRGKLSDDIVMRVRASAPDFWRGQTFDRFDGRTWTLSEPKPFLLPTAEPARLPDLPGEGRVPGSPSFTQTFFIDRPGPNLIFSANRATAVYFPETTLFELTDGTIRTGNEMFAGASYTVISERPLTTAASLRRLGTLPETEPSAAFHSRYTHLGETPQRVRDLADEITRDQSTTYDKVLALESWMGAHTRYSIDIPRLPVGADAVDQFLFEDRVGFCEQIASSLVVMLRAQGVPARLAVGFTPGERNPLTGLFEVRSKNAHAWAEVYFPGVGWQGFDPTADVPLAGEQSRTSAGAGLGSYLARRIGGSSRVMWVAFAVTTMAAVLAGLLVRRAGRRDAKAGRPWSAQMLERIDHAGATLGRHRQPSESASAYVGRLPLAPRERGHLDNAVATLLSDAFAATAASPQERRSAEASVLRLEQFANATKPRRTRWVRFQR